MSNASGAQSLHDGLVEHGLIVPVGVPGAFARGAVFEEVLESFDALVRQVGSADRPVSINFPPVMDRRVLERVRYLDSFPQLCGSVHSFFGDASQATALAEQAAQGQDWGRYLGQTGVVLTPACCYPVYPTLEGTQPSGGRVICMLGWVYRHEPSAEPTRMQAYRIREYVCAGTPDEALEWRDRWLARGTALLESLGLPVRSEVAADPFFGRRGKMMGASQIEQKLKFELVAPVISPTEPTALCSFNYHQEKFGVEFGIRTFDGAVAHTSCLGFGLERVAMALFKQHGFEPDGWPAEVRARLWP